MARTDHHTEQRAQRWRREYLRYNARPRLSRTAILREQLADTVADSSNLPMDCEVA